MELEGSFMTFTPEQIVQSMLKCPEELDFDFYTLNMDDFIYIPGEFLLKPEYIKYSATGASAKEVYVDRYLKSQALGECREPTLLFKILRCKKSIEYHIKAWKAENNGKELPSGFHDRSKLKSPPSWLKQQLGA